MNPAAKRILVSYSHDGDEHRRLVRQLADSLKENGFEVSFDQYLPEDPPEGWPLWMEKEIEFANKVLMVCTKTYFRRVRKEEEPGKGRGVCWEANLIYAELYESQTKTNKFIPVLLRETDRSFVPRPLGTNHIALVNDADGFEKLLRYLLGRANQVAPPTGTTPHLEVPQPLPTFKLKAASGLPSISNAATPAIADPVPPTVLPPSPAVVLRSLKPNTPPQSRFELRQLDWYEEADAGFFRGREADVKSLRSLLLDQPVVRLFGSSGVGKSSLLRAGLVPELRRHGFRSVVVRPFKNPEETIPQQISEQLLSADSPPLSSKLTLERLQAELGPALLAENCPYLFVLIDQVEDVVSPLVPLEARERLVSFLQQVWNAGSASRPLIRALVAYRTDADARLGPLWQEVSGASVGLPYHAIQGLTRDVARRVLADALAQSSQPTPAPLDDLIDELVRESLSLDASGDVFPPYLQMILAQLADNAVVQREGEAPAEPASATLSPLDGSAGVSPSRLENSLAALKIASAGDLIGNYMRSRLAHLESRGGDFAKCRAVLEALSRSTGQKLTLTLGEIAAEVRLSRDAVQPLLEALMASRLVRPVGESYEVQHDRLAETVIASLSDTDREFKAARELLAAKAVNHARTGEWLTAKECHLLYCHQTRLCPTRSELRLIVGSLLTADNFQEDDIGGWLFEVRSPESREQLYFELAQHPEYGVRAAAVPAIASFHNPADLMLFRDFTRDKWLDVGNAAIRAIASFRNSEAMLLLRELARESDVREAAIEAIASYQNEEDLSLLREFARDDDKHVSWAAVRGITSFQKQEDLPLLRELFQTKHRRVRAETVKAIAAFKNPEDVQFVRELAWDERESDGVRIIAIQSVGAFKDLEDLPNLRTLAWSSDESEQLRVAAVLAIGSFDQTNALLHLRRIAYYKDLFVSSRSTLSVGTRRYRDSPADLNVRAVAIQAIVSLQSSEDLPRLRELARNKYETIHLAAISAIAAFRNVDDLQLLRELARDQNQSIRDAAVQGIASFQNPEALPLLRDLSRDEETLVGLAAVCAIASLQCPENLSLLRELARHRSGAVRNEAVRGIAKFQSPEDLPLLRELARDWDSNVRRSALLAIATFQSPEDLPLFRELTRDKNGRVQLAAVEVIWTSEPRKAIEEWFLNSVAALPIAVVARLDFLLYAPEWWRKLEGEKGDE